MSGARTGYPSEGRVTVARMRAKKATTRRIQTRSAVFTFTSREKAGSDLARISLP